MRQANHVGQGDLMFTIAFRDLQWRSRRVAIAIMGSALVIALALTMSGLTAGFNNESRRTVQLARASAWIIDAGGSGPFLQPTPLNESTIDAVVSQVGADHAAPLIFGRQGVKRTDGTTIGNHEHINMLGSPPNRLGSPIVTDGKGISRNGEAVVDGSLGVKIGDQILLSSTRFVVVGTVSGARLLAGVPNVYVTLADAQQLALRGQKLATAVVVDRPVVAPAGTKAVSNADAVTDALRPVVNANKTIAMVRSLLWLVAALIVGSIMFLGVMERTKDVAVLKGMGAKSMSLAASIMVQSAVLALCAAMIGSVIAVVIAPLFPLAAEIPLSSFVLLPAVAVSIAAVSSLGAARRLFSVQPALAFGS
jgi:putative ABC transport system permease protein